MFESSMFTVFPVFGNDSMIGMLYSVKNACWTSYCYSIFIIVISLLAWRLYRHAGSLAKNCHFKHDDRRRSKHQNQNCTNFTGSDRIGFLVFCILCLYNVNIDDRRIVTNDLKDNTTKYYLACYKYKLVQQNLFFLKRCLAISFFYYQFLCFLESTQPSTINCHFL